MNIVSSNQRGKLAGLYNSVENLGCFIGPAAFAVVFAWSISPAAYSWVDYHFIFFLSAAAFGVVAIVCWRTLTPKMLTTPSEPGMVERE